MKKMLMGSLAALGVAGMIGGGTFAAWSDFAEDSGSAGAGILELEVSSTGGAGTTEAFGFGNLAPGVKKIQEIYVASSHADSVPQATLDMTVDNLVGTEDGCHGNSEKADETSNGDTLCDSAAAPFFPGGQFAEQAYIQVRTKPAPSSGACGGGGYPTGVYQGVLSGLPNSYELDNDLGPGEGVCIRIELGLPDGVNDASNGGIDFAGSADSDNAVQGDSASFDITFDLTQNV